MENNDHENYGMMNMNMNMDMANEMYAMPQANVPEMEEDTGAIYPEVFYKLKPLVTLACDVVGTYGPEMPTQRQIETMADGVYQDFCKLYPDMANYMKDDPPGDPPMRGGFRGGPGFGRFFRRRGLGRDFITALLISELLGRGSYYNYF